MKPFIMLLVVFGAIFLMLAVVGQPTYSGADGTTVSYSGTTLFDAWNYEQAQETERLRIAEAQETQRVLAEQEEATKRNADFWQTFPLVVLAIAALAGMVGFAFVGVAFARRPVQPRRPHSLFDAEPQSRRKTPRRSMGDTRVGPCKLAAAANDDWSK